MMCQERRGELDKGQILRALCEVGTPCGHGLKHIGMQHYFEDSTCGFKRNLRRIPTNLQWHGKRFELDIGVGHCSQV